jgi:hypothetical protein
MIEERIETGNLPGKDFRCCALFLTLACRHYLSFGYARIVQCSYRCGLLMQHIWHYCYI